MTRPTGRQRVRGPWPVLVVILWLILASSITLELGQEAAAQWGSAATLMIITVLVLGAAARAAWTPVRAGGRRLRQWIRGQPR